jgi:uncharacterized membrane protein
MGIVDVPKALYVLLWGLVLAYCLLGHEMGFFPSRARKHESLCMYMILWILEDRSLLK